MSKDTSNIGVTVTFRHTDSTPALKSYATDKLVHCLSKYSIGEAEVQVILSVEKLNHTAEANVHSKLYDVSAKAVTDDLYSAIDKVIDTVEVQLRKQKEKQRDYKHQSVQF